jgi:hypothetical protein
MSTKQYIHIAKTGGTSIQKILENNSEYSVYGHELRIADQKANNIFFTIRDPISKFTSAILHILFAQKKLEGNINDFIENYISILDQQKTNFVKNKHILAFYNARKLPLLIVPFSYWLGTLEVYKQHEHKVFLALETSAINKYFYNLGYDPIHYRNHNRYKINFDSNISEANLKFLYDFYDEDHKLYDYIKTRPYYVGNSDA